MTRISEIEKDIAKVIKILEDYQQHFDVRMQVLFCDKHKKFFEEKVKVQLRHGGGVRPSELVSLWDESEQCLECEWRTTFGEGLLGEEW